jgi:hypothetical protein
MNTYRSAGSQGCRLRPKCNYWGYCDLRGRIEHDTPLPHAADATFQAEAVRHVAARLSQQFPELPADDIEHAVFGQYARFEGRPVRDFVPMLVERASRDALAHQHRAAHRA